MEDGWVVEGGRMDGWLKDGGWRMDGWLRDGGWMGG